MRIVDLFILSLIFGLGLNAKASELNGILKNNEGVSQLSSKKTYEAYNSFARALSDLPFEAEVHINLALTFMDSKDFEKAQKEFLSAALVAQKPELKFMSLFNAALATTELKQIDQALELYQSALEIVPDSIEVKTNIELLMQSQNGQGEGENKDDKDQNKDSKGDKPNQDKKDGQDDKDKKKDPKPNPDQRQQNQPQPYKGKDISKENVGKILDELKQQEEQIRAKYNRDGAKNVNKDKDW